MAMNTLDAGGIEPLVDHVRQADEDNPKGYFEFERAKKVKDDAAWLNGASGKVVKMVYRLLYDLPDQHQYRVIFMRRHLSEVLASQHKMLERGGKPADAVSDYRMRTLFASELIKCEAWLARQPNFKVLYIDHRDMINDSLGQAKRINDFLGGGLDVDAMAAVVDPGLYRNRSQG